MGRSSLSADMVQEMAQVWVDEIRRTQPTVSAGDFEAMEQAVRVIARGVCGQALSLLVQGKEEATTPPRACPACGGALRLSGRDRVRTVRGVVGDVTLRRAASVCTACHRGHVPLDAGLGLGPWGLTPALARVVARAGMTASFAEAAELVSEMVGLPVSTEQVRVVTEALGAVAEAEQQEEIVAVKDGTLHESPAGPGTLLVEVDGVHVPEVDGYHEMKIVRVAPLGPQACTDQQSGRRTLSLGSSLCAGGVEDAEPFWARVQMLALRAGLGDATRRVVVLCDGARWIWARAVSFLGGPAREVIEIVDIFHAYEHLWEVGRALYAQEAAAWVEPLKEALYTQGAPAVLAALDATCPSTPQAAELVRTTRDFFADNAARMDYPAFIAHELPIGSGAIESLCKSLVAARAKGAGMRWTEAGVQQIISLRALHRSGSWADFWARHPLSGHQRRWPRKRRARLDTPARVQTTSPPPPVPAPLAPPVPPPQISPWHRGPSVIPKCA